MTWILLFWEKSFVQLFKIPHFCVRDLWAEFYLFTLSISRVACDQVWYKQSSFYKSNFSKPNELVNLFGEA